MNIDDVKQFWNSHPLFSGESQYEPGTRAFFDEHREVYYQDCFGGRFDDRFLPSPRPHGQAIKILDLGCGIGFWTAEFGMRGLQNLTACDLTPQAIKLTEKRLAIYGIEADLREENAENLSFADGTFDHVNCQGVVHHTPNTQKAVSEIARIIKPGGSASISVYYRNIILRYWPVIRWLAFPLSLAGGGLKGRGREQIFTKSNVDEIVRLYDGKDNPIGKSYSREQFCSMLSPYFTINEVFFHFFPVRALPLHIGGRLHRWLDTHIPFMIYANVTKPCAQ